MKTFDTARSTITCRNTQTGAVLIEFSLILIAMLTLFYGIIVYSIVFVTQQTVAYAAESGADAVVAVDPQTTSCDPGNPTIKNVAKSRVDELLRFLPGGATTLVLPPISPGNSNSNNNCELRVRVTYNFSNWGFLVTGLLPLPDQLTAEGLVNTQLPPVPPGT